MTETLDPFQTPEAESSPRQPTNEVPENKVLRTAGFMLIANAALVFIERIVFYSAADAGSPVGGVLPAIIDLAIASSFLRGNAKYKTFAIFRIVLGMFVFAGLSVSNGDYLTPGFVAVGYSGMLMVLIGRPSRGRIMAGVVMFGAVVFSTLLGLLGL